MTRNSFEAITVNLDDLYLWLENPRLLYRQEDEMSCIEQLMTDHKFMALVNDVAVNGIGISPIVVSPADSTGYWVRDGNRRIAVLKLLDDPELCPTDLKGVQKKIQELSEQYQENIPDQIECMYSEDDNTIQKHLFTTHMGEQGGVGQVNWDALMQAAYEFDYGIAGQYSTSYRFLLLGKSYGYKFNNDFPITTLDRLPIREFCDRSKITIPKKIKEPLKLKNSGQSVINSVLRILSDVGDKVVSVSTNDENSTSIRGAGKPKDYINEIIDEYGVENKDTTQTSSNTSSTGPESDSTDTGVKPPKPKPKPRRSEDRIRFIPGKRHTKVPGGYTKERNILAEMAKLNSRDVPTTCIVMLRVFLEATLKTTASSVGLKWNSKGLGKMTELIAYELYKIGDIDKPMRDSIVKLSGARVQLSQAFFTINTIQEFVHSKHSHPDKIAVNIFWDKLDLFIASCWDRVEKNDKEKA